jgi:acetate kinase
MSAKMLLTFNPGSSSVKIGLFTIGDAGPAQIARGVIDFRRDPLTFKVTGEHGSSTVSLRARPGEDLTEIMAETFAALGQHVAIRDIAAIGHRVVHGGDRFTGPVRLDDEAIAAIEALTPLAPLHQPQSLRLICAIRNVSPDLPQTASFDTSFHRTNSAVVRRFAIPRALHDEGVKRYGFHGLSYDYIAGELARIAPQSARGKIVAAHLGSGASLCAIDNGESRDTSMGFSTLDGVPMATRCGALDPGVVLHLLGAMGRPLAEVEDMLYHKSGLLGVSGLSSDSRDLIASAAPEAREAMELFALRIAGETARLAATMGGLDGLVFSAGIGENQPQVRADVCARLRWLGVDLDAAANAANATTISSAASRVAVFVIPTDEEMIIARDNHSVLVTVPA